MGNTSYSSVNSSSSRSLKGTLSNSIDDNFRQNRERKAHDLMKSQGITLREARDSELHPATFPIIIALDMTGSMGTIPQQLIQTGLPTLVSGLIQGGMQSPAILFLGIGDHECDNEPLQVGQFESGDAELDLWLERVYLEGGGGGNMGESYGLAHFFASRYCKTDSFEKRGQKGVLITIGDEPGLQQYPSRALAEIMGNDNLPAIADTRLLLDAQEQWEVYHIDPKDGKDYRGSNEYWTNLLGQNYIKTDDYRKIPELATKVILSHLPENNSSIKTKPVEGEDETPPKNTFL